MTQKIELTKEELEQCKKEAADDAVFRYEVLHKQKLLFKILNGLPEKVGQLKLETKILFSLVFGILIAIISFALIKINS